MNEENGGLMVVCVIIIILYLSKTFTVRPWQIQRMRDLN